MRNRMELTAVIEALSALKESCFATVTSDSKYVTDSANKPESAASYFAGSTPLFTNSVRDLSGR